MFPLRTESGDSWYGKPMLLASLARPAVHHGFQGTHVLFLGGESFWLGGCAHEAAGFLFDVDGGFIDVGGLEGAKVVGGLEALVPGAAILSVQVAACARTLHLGGGEEEVHGLGLVDPLLAAGGGGDDVLEVDAEDGLVLVLEGFRDVVDGVELTVEILELVEHFLVPEVGLFQVLDELAVEDDEVAGEVGFDVEVLVVRLDAGGGAHDVRDGGGGGDGEDVGVAHAVFGDFLADDRPVHFPDARDIDLAAARMDAIPTREGVSRGQLGVRW